MPEESRATENTSGEGQGTSNEKIDEVLKKVETISGVVSDLVTKVSEIDQNKQESVELAQIMQTMNAGESESGKEEEVPPEAKLKNYVDGQLSSINEKLESIASRFAIKTLEMKNPEFNKTIRPIAYKLSQEPELSNLSVERLTSIAEGEIAKQQLAEMKKNLEESKAKLEELEVKAEGDKPGFFVGISEPKGKMTPDEAFEDAFRKSPLKGKIG